MSGSVIAHCQQPFAIRGWAEILSLRRSTASEWHCEMLAVASTSSNQTSGSRSLAQTHESGVFRPSARQRWF